MKIKHEKENPLLARKEVVAEIESDATPKRADVQNQIATLMKVAADHVVVRKVQNAFGDRKAVVHANIYKSPEDKLKYEHKIYLTKGQPRAPKKGTEKK